MEMDRNSIVRLDAPLFGDADRSALETDEALVELLRRVRDPQRARAVRLGPCELIADLGRGRTGPIFRATMSGSPRILVVEVTSVRSLAEQRAFLERSEVLSRIRQASLPAFLGSGVEGPLGWIALELITGPSLDDLVAHRMEGQEVPFGRTAEGAVVYSAKTPGRWFATESSQRALVRWFRDVAEGLSLLHARDLVHGAVRPSVLLVDQRGSISLSGYDEALRRSDPQLAARAVTYRAPEHRTELGGRVRPAQDVFAVGRSFEDALSGRPTFLGGAAQLAAGGHRAGRWRQGSLERILDRAIETDPAKRYKDAVELVEDLDCWLARRPLLHVRESVCARIGHGLRRHAGLVALLLGTTFFWSAGVAVRSLQARGERDRGVLAVEELLGRGEAVLAVERTRVLIQRHREDRSLLDLHRRAILESEGPRSLDLLTRHLLARSGPTPFDGEDSAGAAAVADLRYHQSEDLVFQSVFSDFVRGDTLAARRRLASYAHLASSSALLQELQRLLAVAEGRLLTDERETEPADPIAEFDRIAVDLRGAVRSLARSLVAESAERAGDEVSAKAAWSQVSLETTAVIAADPRHLPARISRARAHQALGDYSAAFGDLEVVATLLSPGQPRESLQAFRLSCALQSAAVGAKPLEIVERALESYDLGTRIEPRRLDHVARDLLREPDGAVVTTWLQALVRRGHTDGRLSNDLGRLIAAAAARASAAEDHPVIDRLFDLVRARVSADVPLFPDGYGELQVLTAWSLLRRIEGPLSREDRDPLTKRLEELIQRERLRMSASASRRYEIDAVGALAQAAAATSPKDVEAARLRLEALLGDAFGEARADATRQYAEILDQVHRRCVRAALSLGR